MSALTEDLLLPLAQACLDADGVSPFGEQTWLDVRAARGGGALFRSSDGDELVAACHVAADGSWAELAVHPQHRRCGVGTKLAEVLLRDHPQVRVWAHGDLPGASALAARVGAAPVRGLLHMSLPGEALRALPSVPLPPGFAARAWTEADAGAWLSVNSRAFAAHPEQGRVTEEDLRARTAEAWFDATGFLLVEDTTQDPAPLAAFHWTKLVEHAGHRTGEVYVLGVDPAYQGRGLARPVTLLGLAHLRSRGAELVDLYVEADNTPALSTYERLGFVRDGIDVMYATSAASDLAG